MIWASVRKGARTVDEISSGQIRAVYGYARKCGMDNDVLHALVAAQTGRESIKELTVRQGWSLIEYLKRLAGEATEDIPGRASEGQRRMIRAIAREMGWTAERLRAFLEKRYGASDVAFLPSGKCGAVIEAMKAIRDGGRGERHG